MTVCASVKTLVRRHEWIGDLFSVLAVALLFATVWAALQYYDPLWNWIVRNNPLIAMPVVVAAAVLDVALIYSLLCAGSQRCEDGKCFRTFRGRRHGGSPSLGSAFGHWVKHMERVGKVHR
jgi:hypothetical protein